MRYDLRSLVCVALLAFTIQGCSSPRPDPSALAAAEDCPTLEARTVEFVIDYAEHANTRSVDEVMSVANDDEHPSLAAGLSDGVQQGLSRADELDCDGQAFREQLQVAETRARDAAQSASSRLLVAGFANGRNIQTLRRALMVVTEAQDAHRQDLGVYAVSVEELRSQVPDFTRLTGEDVDVEVVTAGQEGYCAKVQVPDLPAVYVHVPEMRLSAAGCE